MKKWFFLLILMSFILSSCSFQDLKFWEKEEIKVNNEVSNDNK